MLFKFKISFFIVFLMISNIGFSQKKPLTITPQRNSNNSIDFYYTKTNPGSKHVIITFKKLTNCRKPKVITKTIKGWSGLLFTLRPIDKKKRISYSYRYQPINGSPNAKIDSNFVYILPFKKGQHVVLKDLKKFKKAKHKVDSLLSKSNHKIIRNLLDKTKFSNWKNIAFSTKLNDTIYSVRKGVVIQIFNRFIKQKQEIGVNQTSYITIEHKDGTIAIYSTLKINSSLVKSGDVVYPSTPIALAGSDGKPENSKLLLSVYYLNKDSIFSKYNKYKTFNPVFHTKNGESKLKLKTEYISDYNEEIITKEMKRREKKKWKKKHKK